MTSVIVVFLGAVMVIGDDAAKAAGAISVTGAMDATGASAGPMGSVNATKPPIVEKELDVDENFDIE